ncbi:MAG: UvrD-helicase domain-containing protein, partial [bacterium]|nr:UvrD-helicase domain-containing protein [bacterium]
WNWREAEKTKLTEQTTSAILVIDALPPVNSIEVKEAIADLELDSKRFEPKKMRAIISKKKNEMENPNESEAGDGYFGKVLIAVWRKYEEKTEAAKALDFDDLLLKAVSLFTKHPEILALWQERFRYIHVDEYQDTNLVQYHLTKLLAQKYRNLCVVGDIDQAIYSWRGADFRNILHFERDWPDAKLITLEENYRSTQLILDAANAVIVKNKGRVPKNLFSQKTSGPKLTLFEAANEEEEAQFIAELAKNLIRNKIPPREIAVLYRTNFQSRILEEKMLAEDISYQVVGVKFYERKEIKDALAYLKTALNPDDVLSMKRIINFPPRGIGKVLLTKVLSGDKL